MLGIAVAAVFLHVLYMRKQKEYVEYIARFVGKSNVYPMQIRAAGAIHVEA